MPTIFRDKVTVFNGTFNDVTAQPALVEGELVDWGMDILDGWDDAPEPDTYFASLGAVDGSVAGEFFPVTQRPLLASGYVNATTREAALEAFDFIVRDCFPRNISLTLTRHEPIPKFLDGVYLNGRRTISWTGPRAFRWSAPLLATDPMKYAVFAQVGSASVAGLSSGGRTYPRTYPLEYVTTGSGESSSIVINNNGTGYSPKFMADVTGPLAQGSWRLVNETTAELIQFNVGLGINDTLQVDFYTGVARLNGSLITATIIGDFFRLAPGVNIIKLYGDYDPAATITATAHSAWE
jgi:hypothetical protein